MGIIYVLSNPVIPDLVKIGKTKDLERRAKTLSRHPGVPLPFTIEYAYALKDHDGAEKRLHDAFADHRINPKKEFFRISPHRVIAALRLAPGKDVTPREEIAEDSAEQESLDREKNRQSVFGFSKVGIKPGAELSFARGDGKITAKVVDDQNVKYGRQVTSLSKSALQILQKKFGVKWQSCRGPDYWLYKEETLSERRDRLEQEASA